METLDCKLESSDKDKFIEFLNWRGKNRAPSGHRYIAPFITLITNMAEAEQTIRDRFGSAREVSCSEYDDLYAALCDTLRSTNDLLLTDLGGHIRDDIEDMVEYSTRPGIGHFIRTVEKTYVPEYMRWRENGKGAPFGEFFKKQR
jgi:hypothetical protein